MTSTRLPGKHLLECRDEKMISRLIRRIKMIKNVNKIIIATTQNKADDVFVKVALDEKVCIYRGSETDVMGRVLEAAIENQVDVICEVTGDCPLIDIELTEEAIDKFLKSEFDYLNNALSGLPDGLGCQVFTTTALEKSYNSDISELDKEHVTSHIKRNPNDFNLHYTNTAKELMWPEISLSLDEIADYHILSRIITELEPSDPYFGTEKIIGFFKNHPEILDQNLEIYRRGFE